MRCSLHFVSRSISHHIPHDRRKMLSLVSRCARCTRLLQARGFTDAAPKPRGPVSQKKKSKDSRFVAVGLPLLLFVVGGYATLTQFVGGKYEARDHKIKSQSTRAFDLEEEHKKLAKKLMADDFELKPVPRLDEPRN